MGSAISGEEPTEQLKQKAKNIDAQLLEYKESADYGGAAQSNSQWDNMVSSKSASDLLEESIDPNNNKLNNDPCVQRLTFLVNQYNTIQAQKKSPYQFITSLKSYSLVQLLNDWIHVKSVYVDNKYGNMAFNPLALWDYLNMALKETEESEDIYTRNVRDKSVLGGDGERKDVFNGFSDTPNVVTFQIMDAIHCYMYHGEPVGDNDQKLIKQKREWEVKCGVGAELKNVGTMLSNANDEDDNKDPNKGYKLMREKKDLLLFGDPFFYWEFYEGDPLYCKARYQTLKQEIINNKIFNLTAAQFDDLLFQSKLWQKSVMGQFCTAFNRGGQSNEQYGIEPGLPLTISHIMSILLFCNYDLLRFKYLNQGCNKLNTNEDYQQTKARNQEIGIWYRLIREVVMFYGETTTNQQSFYMSMDMHLLFNSFAPQINAPFVCSTSLSATNIITADTGAIIEYKQHSSLENPYLDISYCSPFPMRDLKLFSYATTLEIRDIYLKNKFGSVQSQRNYVQAMLVWERMINGQYYHNLLDFAGQSYQRSLMKMMDNELTNDKNKRGPTYVMPNYNKSIAKFDGEEENGVAKYIQALFSYIIRNSKEMWIIKSEYEKLSNELRNYLLTLHDNMFKPFTILWNKRLRKTLKQDLVFKFTSEFEWKLDDNDMEEWKNLKDGEMMEGPELSLQQSEQDYDAFVFMPMLAKSYAKNRGGFAVTLKKMPQKAKRVLIEWDLHCQDANDFVMCSPSKVMYSGDTDGYGTFNSSLVANKPSLTFKICVKLKEIM
mmetsp:Transcript_68110/g.61236  ORF Transcript_68110/g.61236 Transcript_68110/m.61236 type:complete len:774 (+) Transcript_68110:70-2391(+)